MRCPKEGDMGKDKEPGYTAKTFDYFVGCAQVVGTIVGVVALIVSFIGLAWAIRNQEAAIQIVRVISGEPTTAPVITVPSTYTPLPTYTPYPTYTPHPTKEIIVPTPVVQIITATPLPTDRPLAPTSVPSSDTPPGTILPVGQTWTAKGISARLAKVTFAFGNEADLVFEITNMSGKTLFFHFNENTHVTMQDDRGKSYSWGNTYEQDVILEDGRTYSERVFKGGNFSGAKYFIITLDLPGIIYAQWRYN